MSGGDNAPIIIKRKKVSGGGGHHGGAWKVAYADFVTAMMAFFMLMWLLNATTENQRKGLADYFSPSIPLSRVSGGGDGAFGGDSVFAEETLPQNGTGASNKNPTDAQSAAGQFGNDPRKETADAEAQAAAFGEVESLLMGQGGESMVSENALRHIITRVTDEGLIVELFDLEDALLFDRLTDEPTPLLLELTGAIVRAFDLTANDIAVKGFTQTKPVVVRQNRVWALSVDRAEVMRLLMEDLGLPAVRFQRVAGYADRAPAHPNPLDIRNNRLEIVLLREQP